MCLLDCLCFVLNFVFFLVSVVEYQFYYFYFDYCEWLYLCGGFGVGYGGDYVYFFFYVWCVYIFIVYYWSQVVECEEEGGCDFCCDQFQVFCVDVVVYDDWDGDGGIDIQQYLLEKEQNLK